MDPMVLQFMSHGLTEDVLRGLGRGIGGMVRNTEAGKAGCAGKQMTFAGSGHHPSCGFRHEEMSREEIDLEDVQHFLTARLMYGAVKSSSGIGEYSPGWAELRFGLIQKSGFTS